MSTLAHHPPNSQHQRSKAHSADHHPYGITSRVPGLYFASLPANFARHGRDTVHSSVDDALVHHVPEHVRRDPKERPDNHRTIDFVHIIFIEQKLVETVTPPGKFFGPGGVTNKNPQSHKQPDDRKHHRWPSQRVK